MAEDEAMDDIEVDEDTDAEFEEDDADDVLAEPDVEDEDADTAVLEDDEEGEEADDEPVVTGPRKGKDDEEGDDEDDIDPDDVEADLDAILKDRIAAADEDDDEDEEVAPEPRKSAVPDGVVPKKSHEFTCTGCFLLVNRAQFGPTDAMECPVGEFPCPAIEVLGGTQL